MVDAVDEVWKECVTTMWIESRRGERDGYWMMKSKRRRRTARKHECVPVRTSIGHHLWLAACPGSVRARQDEAGKRPTKVKGSHYSVVRTRSKGCMEGTLMGLHAAQGRAVKRSKHQDGMKTGWQTMRYLIVSVSGGTATQSEIVLKRVSLILRGRASVGMTRVGSGRTVHAK